MQLREYQSKLIDEIRMALAGHQSVLAQGPTGMGKTALTCHMIDGARRKGRSAWFIVHRNELLEQTSVALWQQGVPHGIISSGRKQTRMPVQVASVQTLVNRLDRLDAPDLLVTDECHHAVSPGYLRVVNHCHGSKHVGLTATPERLDGAGLGSIYQTMVTGPSVRWLIESGYLAEYRLIAPATVAADSLHTRAGDYVRSEVERAMDRPTITGDAVRAYQHHAAGKRCVVFCVTRKHARHVLERYQAAGIASEYVGGDSEKTDRRQAFDRFAAGQTLVLVSVDVVSEGVDVPAIEAVQLLRPTKSLGLYLQQVGRALRPADGKQHAIILDHVGNWSRHGLPDDERAWSLDGRAARKRKEPEEEALALSHCHQCHAIFRRAPSCPACGFAIGDGGREVEVVDGELVEIDLARVRREQRQEVARARTLERLVAVALDQGHKPASAGIRYAARNGLDRGRCIAEAYRIAKRIQSTQTKGVI